MFCSLFHISDFTLLVLFSRLYIPVDPASLNELTRLKSVVVSSMPTTLLVLDVALITTHVLRHEATLYIKCTTTANGIDYVHRPYSTSNG